MKLPEQAVTEGTLHPASRLIALLGGTWLIGAFFPILETLWRLFIRRGTDQSVLSEFSPNWFDPEFAPVLGAIASPTVLVSGPLAVFCVVCSALDRGDWRKITLLSGISTAFMNFLDSISEPESWLMMTLLQAIIILLLWRALRPLAGGP